MSSAQFPPPVVTLEDLYAGVNFSIAAVDNKVQLSLNLHGVAGMRKVMEPVQARHIGERLIQQANLAEAWKARSVESEATNE